MGKFNIKNSVIGAVGSFVNVGNNLVNSMNVSGGNISMSTSGNHTTLIINGRKYEIESSNVIINGKDIYVDGKLYDLGDPDLKAAEHRTIINITVEGNTGDLSCNGDIEVKGYAGDIDTTGDVTVGGNSGDINTTGDVTVKGNISGNINTMGDVDVNGNCLGKISTMGDVTVKSSRS